MRLASELRPDSLRELPNSPPRPQINELDLRERWRPQERKSIEGKESIRKGKEGNEKKPGNGGGERERLRERGQGKYRGRKGKGTEKKGAENGTKNGVTEE